MAGEGGEEAAVSLLAYRSDPEYYPTLRAHQIALALMLPVLRGRDSAQFDDVVLGFGGAALWQFLGQTQRFPHHSEMLDKIVVETEMFLTTWADRFDPHQMMTERVVLEWEDVVSDNNPVGKSLRQAAADQWEDVWNGLEPHLKPITKAEVEAIDITVSLIFVLGMSMARLQAHDDPAAMLLAGTMLSQEHDLFMKKHVWDEDGLQQSFNLFVFLSRMLAKAEAIRQDETGNFFRLVDISTEKFVNAAADMSE